MEPDFLIIVGFVALVVAGVCRIEIGGRLVRRSQELKQQQNKGKSVEEMEAEARLVQLVKLIPKGWTDVLEQLTSLVESQLPAMVDRREKLANAMNSLVKLAERYEENVPTPLPMPDKPLKKGSKKYIYNGVEYQSWVMANEYYERDFIEYVEREQKVQTYQASFECAELTATGITILKLNGHLEEVRTDIRNTLVFLDHFEATIHASQLLTDGDDELRKSLALMAERAAEQARKDSVVESELRTIDTRANAIPIGQAKQLQKT